MDRRIRKTRENIFNALKVLLSKKDFNKITVDEIINYADVGRATFYSHFETKDYLLKELCEDLFCHIFDSISDHHTNHNHMFECNPPQSVFLHLFNHFKNDDHNILALIAKQENEIFLFYLKNNLNNLILKEIDNILKIKKDVPQDFWINHISSTFIETLKWWYKNNLLESSETITNYFINVLVS